MKCKNCGWIFPFRFFICQKCGYDQELNQFVTTDKQLIVRGVVV